MGDSLLCEASHQSRRDLCRQGWRTRAQGSWGTVPLTEPVVLSLFPLLKNGLMTNIAAEKMPIKRLAFGLRYPGLGAGAAQGLSGCAWEPSTAGSRLISCSLTSFHYGDCRRCSLISLLNYELGSGSLCSCSRLVIPTTLFPHLLIKPGAPSCNKHFKYFF